MHPILFTLGPLKVFSYGFMIAIGLFLSFMIIRRRGDYKGIKADRLIDLIIATTCVGLIGARVMYIATFPEEYAGHWFDVVKVWEGGLVLYGGTITALIFLLVYARIKREGFFLLTDAIVPYFALVQGFGRIGCFLNGCCGGMATDSYLGVHFPGADRLVHPTQLYSAALCFSVAALLFRTNKLHYRIGYTTLVYFLVYPIGRFFIEFLRTNPRVFAGLLSHAQVISITLFTMALIVFIAKKYWFFHER